MNIKIFNNQFEEIANTMKEIFFLKNEIQNSQFEIKNKKERNFTTFNLMYESMKKKEEEVKILSDNKYFTYSEMIDFIKEGDVFEAEGFGVEYKTGCVMKSASEKISKLAPRIITVSGDGKTVICEFDNSAAMNQVDFSFYSETGAIITPSETFISTSGEREKFFEPNFRFFNRNSNEPENTFTFKPKKIDYLEFNFDSAVNRSNIYVRLTQNVFEINNDHFFIVKFNNNKGLKKLNFFKTTDESTIPLRFYFSENLLDYKEMEFNNYGESIISNDSGGEVYIKVTSDYDKALLKTQLEKKTYDVKSSESKINEYSYNTIPTTSVMNYSVKLSHYSYKLLKDELKSEGVDISEFVSFTENGFEVKKEYINFINYENELDKKIMTFDDYEIVKTDKKYFNFYLCKSNNVLYCSAFMDKLDFFITVITEEPKGLIEKNYYTPYVFELGVKG